MYKLLLADDDKMVLESFYELVDWNKYGFEVVARLGDGTEVLKFLESKSVDAIITDIKMPEMDGIELVDRLSESYPDIKVVFLSAFCDIFYTRQAIKYGVVDYITKPIVLTEVNEVLQKLYATLEEKRDEDKSKSDMSQQLLKRKELFRKILSSKMLDINEFNEDISYLNILCQSLQFNCAVAIFEIMSMEKQLKENWGNNRNKLCETISKEICVDIGQCYTIQLDFSGNLLAVLYISKENTVPNFKKYIGEAIDNLWSVYKIMAVNETIVMFDSFEEFKNDLIAAKTEKMKYLNGKILKNDDEEMIKDVQGYIERHYQEDITVGMLAKEYHFSEKYFGKIFKKITGKNFVDYLNEVRIENAKILLQAGLDIETVCMQVGFGTRRYFNEKFTSFIGVTPGKYRKNQMEANNESGQETKS